MISGFFPTVVPCQQPPLSALQMSSIPSIPWITHVILIYNTSNCIADMISVMVSSVALRLGSEMDSYQRDLTNILLSYLVSDSFGPVLGASAWLQMTTSNHLSLPRLRITSETLGKKCLKLPPELSMFCITFLLYGSMGLTILDHIYSLLL